MISPWLSLQVIQNKRDCEMAENRSKIWFLCPFAPFVILLVIYWLLADQRHADNPNDRLMPLPAQLYAGLKWTLTPGAAGLGNEIPIYRDTIASFARLIAGLIISGSLAMVLALSMHVSRFCHEMWYPLVVVIAKIPPIALLPILLLWMGVTETSKIGLLVLGLSPYLCLNLKNDLQRNSIKFSEKLSTLPIPVWQQLIYIDIPTIWPSFLHNLQISLGPAWLFLLVAESIGAKHGLGYRIFVVRRYLAMDIILVYVLWITLLSVVLYTLIGLWKKKFSWYFNE